jgi:hypothetical protein
MTKNLHPEWFDLSLSILFQQGLVEETDEGGYKLTMEGEKEAKQATSVMYNGKSNVLRNDVMQCITVTHRTLSTVTAGYWIKADTEHQLHLRRSERSPKERRFLRPNDGPASSWVDNPTTVKEENQKIPKIVHGSVWLATPLLPMLLKDGKEMAVVDGVVRTVTPKFHDRVTFNQRMREVGLAGIPDDDSDDATVEMSITQSENERNIMKSGMGDDIEPWEMRK